MTSPRKPKKPKQECLCVDGAGCEPGLFPPCPIHDAPAPVQPKSEARMTDDDRPPREVWNVECFCRTPGVWGSHPDKKCVQCRGSGYVKCFARARESAQQKAWTEFEGAFWDWYGSIEELMPDETYAAFKRARAALSGGGK